MIRAESTRIARRALQRLSNEPSTTWWMGISNRTDHILSAGTAERTRQFSSKARSAKYPSRGGQRRGSSSRGGEQEYTAMRLDQAQGALKQLLTRLADLNIPSQPFNSSAVPENVDRNDLSTLLQDTRDLLQTLKVSVQDGTIRPSGKHGKELSRMMEFVLKIYSHAGLPSLPTFHLCQEALGTLETWNLDCRHNHFECAIIQANREENWKEASNLFWKQIDPEAGHNPVVMSIQNPHGLYAVARLAQQEKSAVAELVFDAVMQLSMISSSDQPTYVLAAGTVLGQTGEWEAAVEFLKTSYLASHLGRPLVASVMHACLRGGRPEVALQVYEDSAVNQGSIAGEWQWGGEIDIVDPLLRDMAMRSMWSANGNASASMELFRESIDDGVSISSEALLGVARAIEQDGDVNAAVSLLLYILDHADRANWIVDGSALAIHDCTRTPKDGSTPRNWLPAMGEVLASVMRTCNSTSSFGTSLFGLRLVELALSEARTPSAEFDLAESIAPALSKLGDPAQVLNATMVALCGLRCYDDAIQLYDIVEDSEWGGEEIIHDARSVREHASTQSKRQGSLRLGNPWISAHRHTFRLTAAIGMIEKSRSRLSADDEALVHSVLAAAMNACTEAHQPDLSIRLLAHVERVLPGTSPGGTAAAKDKTEEGIILGDQSAASFRDDGLTAAAIHAYKWNRDLADAVGLFESLLHAKSHELANWRLSCDAGLSALVTIGRGKDADQIFRALDKPALSSDSYSTIGRFLSTQKRDKEVLGLYRSALDHGFLSEELSLLAMAAVSKSNVDNRLRILRTMVNENARVVGIDRNSWMSSRYWHVKKALGFRYARLLMWWNDPETCHLDELELAVTEFQDRRAHGLRVKNDVVRSIIDNAKSFDEVHIPHEPLKWAHVPFSTQDWISLLRQVVEESRSSPLYHDASFISDTVDAFRNLRSNEDCTAFVREILDSKTGIHERSLLTALKSVEKGLPADLASDIRMLAGRE